MDRCVCENDIRLNHRFFNWTIGKQRRKRRGRIASRGTVDAVSSNTTASETGPASVLAADAGDTFVAVGEPHVVGRFTVRFRPPRWSQPVAHQFHLVVGAVRGNAGFRIGRNEHQGQRCQRCQRRRGGQRRNASAAASALQTDAPVANSGAEAYFQGEGGGATRIQRPQLFTPGNYSLYYSSFKYHSIEFHLLN